MPTLPTRPHCPRLPRRGLPLHPQEAPPSLVAADLFDPDIARGYAAWVAERRAPYARTTLRDTMTRRCLLTLANACDR